MMFAGTAMHPHTTPITGSSYVPSQQEKQPRVKAKGMEGRGMGWPGRWRTSGI